MLPIDKIKSIFENYGGVMRTADLSASKIYYTDIQRLIRKGVIEKVRYGYYQWLDKENYSEVTIVTGLFPDGIFCMNTALFYYGYSDRTPLEWHLAVNKDSGKSRFNIDYPFVKPYFIEPAVLNIGLTSVNMDGHQVRIYDKERVICDCLRYVKKMDKEIFNKAIQAYVNDNGKNIPCLMEYAKKLRTEKKVKDWIGVWL